MSEITIIMPVFNSEKTIKKAIESVLEQTFREWELIIIDDHSTDNTKNIIDEYIKKCGNRIVYLKNKKKGVSSARNYGILNTKTKYLSFLDSDDELDKNFLKVMCDGIKDVELVVCGYIRNILSKQRRKNTFWYDRIYNTNDFSIAIQELQQKCLFNQIWNKIYITNIIKKNKIKFNEEINVCEDELFNLQYLKYIERIKNTSQILYLYNSSNNGLNFKYVKNRLNIKLSVLEYERYFFGKENGNYKYIDKLYIYTCLSGLCTIFNDKENINKKREFNEFIKNADIHTKINEIIKTTKEFDIKIIRKNFEYKRLLYIWFLCENDLCC